MVVNFGGATGGERFDTAVDVVLLDTTFWGEESARKRQSRGGMRDVSHSESPFIPPANWEFSLRQCRILGAVLPNLSFSRPTRIINHLYGRHRIRGGLMPYENGAIRVPNAPGLGVKLNRDKLAEYSELYKRLGGYPYDQDPGRPGWTPILPNTRFADPRDDRAVKVPF